MLEDAQQWADRAMYDSARRLVERARGMRVEWSDDELDPEQLLDEIDRLQFGNDESSTAASDVEQAPPRFTDLNKGEVDDSRRSGLSTGFIPLPPEYFRQATSSKPVPIQITTTDDALSRSDILLLLIGSMVGGAILIGGLHVVLSRFETSLKDVRVELVHRGEGRVFTSTETPPQEPRAEIESAASPDQPVATKQPNDPPPPHPSPDHDPPKRRPSGYDARPRHPGHGSSADVESGDGDPHDCRGRYRNSSRRSTEYHRAGTD